MPNPLPLLDTPTNDLEQNARFANLAVELATQAGTTIGSIDWIFQGDYPQSWSTGGHYSEGWNHDKYVDQRREQILTVSNSMSRRRRWPFANKRKIGYGDGELPIELATGWEPDGTPTGYQVVGGVKIWAFDCEHFNLGQLISLCERNPQETVEGLTWNGEQLPPLKIGDLAKVEMKYVQDSICDQFATWLSVRDSSGNPSRPSDRVVARGTYAFIRGIPFVGLEGSNEIVGREWINQVSRWLASGPHLQTSKIAGTMPAVPLPYWNPVHSYGYMVPVVYWLLNNYGGTLVQETRERFEEFLIRGCSEIQRLVHADGATPWAVATVSGVEVEGFLWGPNGDQYTPAYEVFTALHVAQRFQFIVKTDQAIKAISAKFPRDRVFGPWMCDAHFLNV